MLAILQGCSVILIAGNLSLYAKIATRFLTCYDMTKFTKPHTKVTTLSRFPHQNDTQPGLRVLSVALWENLVLILKVPNNVFRNNGNIPNLTQSLPWWTVKAQVFIHSISAQGHWLTKKLSLKDYWKHIITVCAIWVNNLLLSSPSCELTSTLVTWSSGILRTLCKIPWG